MFHYVYVLRSKKDESLYIGCTADLQNRIKEHNRGVVKSTKKSTPWICIYFEACLNTKDATRRERYLKTSQGSRLLKRRLKEYFYSRE